MDQCRTETIGIGKNRLINSRSQINHRVNKVEIKGGGGGGDGFTDG